MPTKETLKRALQRAVWAMVMGACSAYVMVPINLEDPKKYVIIVGISMIAGALMGLQKLVSGWIKYDRQ